jgi:AcrR family transcriptional regulator
MAAAIAAIPLDDTRGRLIEAAGAVFAEHGYRAATVREICARAGANVAAINYHFRDKMGLYVAVVRESMGGPGDPRHLALDGKAPDEALRLLIGNMVQRIVGGETPAIHLRIMSQELTHPTEALARIAEEVIGPNYALLRGVLGKVMNLDPLHDLVRLCAHSIIGQVVHYGVGKPVIGLLWPAMKMKPRQVGQIARHISDFSLAGIRAVNSSIARDKSGKRKT